MSVSVKRVQGVDYLSGFALALVVLNLLNATAIMVGSWLLFRASIQLPDLNYAQLSFVLGIVNICLGILASLVHMVWVQGGRATLILVGLCLTIAGGAELLSTTTGFPFGHYSYTDRLGPKFFGQVPYLIPLSWFMMIYPSLHLAHSFPLPRGVRPLGAAAILTLWDVAMDPAVTTGFTYWVWHSQGDFYGMPWYNWLGWLGVGWLIGELFERLHPSWRRSSSALPMAIWLIQGATMAGLALSLQRPWASLFWAVGASAVMLAFYTRRRAERHA